MTDAPPPTIGSSDPGTSNPGERRLARPPSDRYRAAEARAEAAAAAAADASGSIARGLALAIVVALIGAVSIVVLGGALAITTGLVVVAGATGLGVALALQLGAGPRLTSRRRIALAVVLTLLAIGLGQLGLWQYARSEGGVLALADYLGEVYGPLVPVEFAAGLVAAWVVAR